MKNKTVFSKTLIWIARIASIPSVLFILFMLGAHVVNPEPLSRDLELKEITLFLLFPLSVTLGLIAGWKWPLAGGLVGTLGIIGFHLVGQQFELIPWIDGLASPALLFLVAALFWNNKNVRIESDINKKPNLT